jgi:hypothetical protein
MVDYRSLPTVGTTPGAIVKIQVLELRSYVGDAIEAYIKVNERTPSMNTDLSIIRSRLYHLWKEIGAHYKRTEGQERATIIKMGILSARTWEDLDALYDVLDEYLDEKRLTRFDTKKDIDTTDVEAENEDAEN